MAKASPAQTAATRRLQGFPVTGVTNLGGLAHALGRAYNATFHDPYIHYSGMNEYALAGLPHGASFADTYAGMRQDLTQLDPVRLAILRGVLAGSGVNADSYPDQSPLLQQLALRGLNPQTIRAF